MIQREYRRIIRLRGRHVNGRGELEMVYSKPLDKILLYTDDTDNTVSSVKRRKKLRPIRETCTEPVEVSVYKRP